MCNADVLRYCLSSLSEAALSQQKNDRNNCQSFMEEEYRQGLNLVVRMLRSLENLPDFRADTFTLQRIARLADLPKYTVAVEGPSASEPPPMEEAVPREVLLGDSVEAQTIEQGATMPSFEEL